MARDNARSKPEFGPNGPAFRRRNQPCRPPRDTVQRAERIGAGRPATEQARQHAPRRRYQRRLYLVAIAGAQRRTKIADRVGQPQRDRSFSRPILTGEQHAVAALEAASAARLNEPDEDRKEP